MQVFKNLSSRTLRTSPQGCGVWIRVHFLRTRIQLLFSADPDQLKTPLLRNCHEIHDVAYIFVFFPSGTVFVDCFRNGKYKKNLCKKSPCLL